MDHNFKLTLDKLEFIMKSQKKRFYFRVDSLKFFSEGAINYLVKEKGP